MGQTVSSTQFFLYGRRHSTQTGYYRHVKNYDKQFPVQTKAAIIRGADGADGVDMDGKVVVVTGANSGIGKELGTYAAAKGAKVYIMCRNAERAEAARTEIMEQTSSDQVHILLADTSELAQVEKAVKELQSKEEKVDCLVCNAGALLNDKKLSSEGNEVVVTSHLIGGSYLLSTLLLPQLKAAGSESRVVFVTSGGLYNTKFPSWEKFLNTNEKDKYDGTLAYSYAKRGQLLLAERYTEEQPQTSWLTVHPGWTNTNAVSEAFGDQAKYLEPMRTTWEGAEGITWLMATAREHLSSGALYLDRKTQTKHLSGPFMTKGSFTKNTKKDVDDLMSNLNTMCKPFLPTQQLDVKE
eukprot:CAMPEP_0197824520 /NCGR_PEP_ID=MMETSP1437-20131217/1739_1 /TAXON_ID=49252 ORGANISM="Eucampia antarctica, Strain CCMP1452" /NCGR_SAMPLE_ID=MMETSP1437 /ASSEMBLY_ACC=CAM_ASM_001096 /LENGTH=352 /DNA_ID=CAMNT_0043424169 /DNA_START=96 /DNA_END=1154 /DNA_ORIENTATION=-